MKYILILLVVICGCHTKDNKFTVIDTSVNSDIKSVSLISKSDEPLRRKYDPRILKPLSQLLTLLKTGTITYYNWSDNCSCNVGLVAQLCSGRTKREMFLAIDSLHDYHIFADEQKKRGKYTGSEGSWSNMANYYCGITNRKVKNIIGDLQNAGFNVNDISGLEYLSDNYILSKTDIKIEPSYYADGNNLVKYLTAWCEIIKNQP